MWLSQFENLEFKSDFFFFLLSDLNPRFSIWILENISNSKDLKQQFKQTHDCFSAVLQEVLVKHCYDCDSNRFKNKHLSNLVAPLSLFRSAQTGRHGLRSHSSVLWSYQSCSHWNLLPSVGCQLLRRGRKGLLISTSENAGPKHESIWWCQRSRDGLFLGPLACGSWARGHLWSSAKAPARAELKHMVLSFWGAFAWAQKVISAAQWSRRVHEPCSNRFGQNDAA